MFFTKRKANTVKVGNSIIEWNPSGNCWDETVNINGKAVRVKYIVSPGNTDPNSLVTGFKRLNLYNAAYEYTVNNCQLTEEYETEEYDLMAVIVSSLSIEFLYRNRFLGARHCVCTEYDYRKFHDCYIR